MLKLASLPWNQLQYAAYNSHMHFILCHSIPKTMECVKKEAELLGEYQIEVEAPQSQEG